MHAEEQIRSPQRSVYDPFSGKNDIAWLTDRVQEGYFGPTASYDRSPTFQFRFEGTSLPRITSLRDEYRDLLTGKTKKQVKPLQTDGATQGPETIPWNKDVELSRLAEEWKTIPKGGKEELAWVERAIALSAAGFEEYQHNNGRKDFSMRDNQLYYMTALLLDKGHYEFGTLETEMRGIELPTGEGKTFCFGLVAPIFGLQESPVVVMEPNYVSAQNHAAQMAGFYEEFFRQSTGAVVSVPEKEGVTVRQLPDAKGVFGPKAITTGGYKSYRCINGQMVEEPGNQGRKKAWEQKIIYIDPDSLAFDWLADHQIGMRFESGQPALEKMTVLVAEADDLMLDKARNPFIISELVKGDKAWNSIGEIAGLDILYPPDWPEKTRQRVTQRAIFTLWGNLYEAKRTGYFKEGFGDTRDYMLVNRRLKDSERLTFKANNIVAKNLRDLFGYDASLEEGRVNELLQSWGAMDIHEEKGWDNTIELLRRAYRFNQPQTEKAVREIFASDTPKNLLPRRILDALREDHEAVLGHAMSDIVNAPTRLTPEEMDEKLSFLTPENRATLIEMAGWIEDNSQVVDAAIQALFGMQTQVDFIGKDKPVLLDEYGFPLERRQLQDVQQIFLQLYHSWQNEQMEDKQLTPEILGQLEKKYAPSVEVSYTMNRITMPALLEKCKRVRFSSGSLLPAASSFSDLFGAEVLAASRHMDIPSQTPPEKETAMLTRCLDGGLAQIDYLDSGEGRLVEFEQRAKAIHEAGTMGLFIVPDIRMAEELKRRIPQAEISTGAEELRERGLLDKVTSVGKPGKVVITTWIAHRDIDVKMPQEVLDNGGLDCVVCGIPPTERGLWQALQRALRGDQPGTRSLLLTPQDFEPLRNRDVFGAPMAGLIHRPAAKTHAEAVKKIDSQWKNALQGDGHAMEQLFNDYLKYLRGKEEAMKHQLMRIMMRDSDLEKWQGMFTRMTGRLPEQSEEYIQQIRTEARKRIPPAIPSIHAMPARQGEDRRRTDAVLSRLESQFGYIAPEAALLPRVMEQIKQEDIREGWADFLRFLELDVYTFLLDPDIQKMPPDMQRGLFRVHVESLLKQQETEQR